MSTLITSLISIVTTLLVAGLLSWLRIKQLYLVVPKLFEFSALTDKGTILELQVFNKSRSTEEEVHIDLPPHVRYDLIAADHSNARIEKNVVILPRMPPLSEASLIVLAEAELNLSALVLHDFAYWTHPISG